ncbi:transposase family protein [Streptomyces torulosus]|uniref:transposase family protein n=1 Tax=Streptomyces torulosus TaxID=68276 RepID=UPI003B831AD9
MTVLIMQADASFWDCLVFGGIDDVDVETVDVVARGRTAGAACPDCGRFSGRVQDSYQRRLKDVPLGGQNVVIRLTVRRFIRGAGNGPRRTCSEPFARLTTPYARSTTRLNHALERPGLALAGQAGARLEANLASAEPDEDAQAGQDVGEGGSVAGLSGGEDEGQRSAVAVGDEVNLSAQSTAGPAGGVVCRLAYRCPFLRTPTACWCARTMVECTETVQLRSSSASAWAISAMKTRSQVPSMAHLGRRL